MFRDQYRRDNDKIEPEEATLKYLSFRMKEAGNKTPEKNKRHKRIRPVMALAACFAFVLTGLYAYKHIIDSKLPAEVTESDTQVKPVSTYKELYTIINSLESTSRMRYGTNKELAATADTDTSVVESGSYSQTNVQVEGIDEADVVKTDGTYIYTMNNLINVSIYSANDGNPGLESCISLSGFDTQKSSAQPLGIYVQDNRLVILLKQYGDNDSVIQAVIYDITDRSHPVLMNTFGQSGDYLSSRLIGNTLYLVSNYGVGSKLDKNALDSFVPQLYDGGNGSPMAAGDICISTAPQGPQYAVVTAIDVQKGERLSSKSILSCGSTLYANEKNLYIASTVTENTLDSGSSSNASDPTNVTITSKTNLIRISLADGQIAVEASGSVPGRLLNQYSMDEYNGTLRLVTTADGYTQTNVSNVNGAAYYQTTDSTTSNALYTLDQNLNVLGSITDVANGEKVYSVRFNGAVCYFVTFRQVDPLFTVDVSDPASPKILGELKIPGLSDYLHPYSNGLLFGLGRDSDTGHVNGLKLSMFDISDPANVTEKNKLLLDERWSVVSWNYKAITVSAEKSLIAFPADTKYLIFSYSPDTGFTQKAELSGANGNSQSRGLFIGNVFYVVSDSKLTAYRMDDYSVLSSVGY